MPDLVADVRSVLVGIPDRWRSLALVAPHVLARPPEPGEWSALQCLQHVVATETLVFPPRVRACLAGEPFDPFDPDETAAAEPPASDIDPVTLAERLAAMRAGSLAVLDGLAESDLGATGIHPRLGAVTLRELLNTWAAHDTMHVVQAERALMQAFVPHTGGWRGFFTDHDVELHPKAAGR
jgi:hypothetical protein